MYQLSIQGISNEKMTVDLGEDEGVFKKMTIRQLKEKIIKENGLSLTVEQLRLLFAAKQLENENTLEFYKIIHKSTIMSVVRVPGGR